MRAPALGLDQQTGLVHYDSYAKRTYIWPLCRTPYLDLFVVHAGRVVTCIKCLAAYVEHDWASRHAE